MFYEEYYNGRGWGVRRITDESGHWCDDEHIVYYGSGQDNFVSARKRAAELNSGRECIFETAWSFYMRHFKKEYGELGGAGYAPKEWRSLYKHLRSLDFTDVEMIDSKLCISSKDVPYDRFRNRTIYITRDIEGDIIGMAGVGSGTPRILKIGGIV